MRPVFVGGCPRSGTTLLGSMLGFGPDLLTVPEALFKFTVLPKLIGDDGQIDARRALASLSEDDFFRRWRVTPTAEDLPRRLPNAELIDHLVEAFGRSLGKPQPRAWIDHTPGNIRYAGTLGRMFPTARFLHLVRDGRAVAASVLPLDWGPNTIADAARWWSMHIAVGLAAERTMGADRVLTMRFEDIVRDPEIALQKICSFLDLPYDERMVSSRDFDARGFSRTDQHLAGSPPDPSRAVAWKQRLTKSQVEHFEHMTWDLLDLLDYEMVHGPTAQMAGRRERLTAFAHDVLRRGITDRIRRQWPWLNRS